MKKFIMLMALIISVISFGVGITVSAQAAPTKLECDGIYEGGSYHSVTVPEGASCTLIGVDVAHNVKALHNAVDVKVLDSTVGGNVHVKGATGLVHVGQTNCRFDPPVRVNVLVYDSHHVLICYVSAHNIQVKRNDGRITIRDNLAHRIDVSGNKPCVDCKNGHRKPGAIRLLRNVSETHIHVFHNKRKHVILKDNAPDPIVR